MAVFFKALGYSALKSVTAAMKTSTAFSMVGMSSQKTLLSRWTEKAVVDAKSVPSARIAGDAVRTGCQKKEKK